MKILRNRSFAVAVMLVMIVVAVLFGSHRSLSALRNEVDSAFRMGVQGDGYSIQNSLEKRNDIAYNLLVIALRYYSESDPAVRAVQDARDAFSKAVIPGEKATVDQKLTESMATLYDQLKQTELSEKDEKYPARLYTDFTSAGHIISNDGYNALAEEYNRKLRQFPASVLAGVTGVKPVSLFQQGAH